ncbi:MAG: transcription factor S, partial [Halobacteriales archaeon]
MQFCDECGSMMKSVDGEMVCTSCGATAERDEAVAEQFVTTETQTDDDVIESDPDANFEGKPT